MEKGGVGGGDERTRSEESTENEYLSGHKKKTNDGNQDEAERK